MRTACMRVYLRFTSTHPQICWGTFNTRFIICDLQICQDLCVNHKILNSHTRTPVHRFGQGNPQILEVAQRISQLTSWHLQLKFKYTSVQSDHFNINIKQQLNLKCSTWYHFVPFTHTHLQCHFTTNKTSTLGYPLQHNNTSLQYSNNSLQISHKSGILYGAATWCHLVPITHTHLQCQLTTNSCEAFSSSSIQYLSLIHISEPTRPY